MTSKNRLAGVIDAQTEVPRELLELLRGQHAANHVRRRRRDPDPEPERR